jgi:zinc protease
MGRMGVFALLAVGGCVLELPPRPRPPAAPASSGGIGLAIDSTTLASGLRVIRVRDPRARELQITMRYAVGASSDGAHPGLAHFVEHLMFQQDRAGQPLFMLLEDTATYFNAATTFDATTYVTRGPTSALTTLLSIEAIRIEDRCKGLSEAAFVHEREVVLHELAQRDQASEILRAINVALYPEGHPYRASVGGSAASLDAITRDHACQFVDSYYAPSNAVLVISGPLETSEIDAALAQTFSRVTRRAGNTPRALPATVPHPRHVEIPAPLDDDALVIAWPLPLDPTLQAEVRAVGAALPRLVDAEIAGNVIQLELGDVGAPMLALAVVGGDNETLRQLVDRTRLAVAKLPGALHDVSVDNLADIAFDRVKQGAIYNSFSALQDGSDRDTQLARAMLAGVPPAAAIEGEIHTLRRLSAEDAAEIAKQYLAFDTPTVVTLKASATRRRGDKVSIRPAAHDFGQRRAPVDPAIASQPATSPISTATVGSTVYTLPNGLSVVLLPVATVPTVEARLVFAAGSADEPSGLEGVAMFAAQTLTWDLRHLDDALAFIRAGGLRDADVSSDRTSFRVRGLDDHLDVVLAALRRWVCDGVYDNSAASFVNAMHREAKRADDQGLLTDAWRASLFGANHPYVKAGLVRYANRALRLEDARAFRIAYFEPTNATLVIAGRFDAALARRWVDFVFSSWRGVAAGRRRMPTAPQPAAIAKVDDTSLVQLKVALPAGSHTRAQLLVAAAMLSDIARDVRYRLGASYTFDAQLAESRLSTLLVLGGFVDSQRAREAVELIVSRVGELQRDPVAAARSFVVARNHVLAQLGTGLGSASALADRVERDIEIGRKPLSDLETADAVALLTIHDMTSTLAQLDLARAIVLMDGPANDIQPAFAALGRTPFYVQPSGATSNAPGTIPPPFYGEEQYVTRSQLVPALTLQPPSHLAWLVAAYTGFAGGLDNEQTFTGYTLAAGVGYRYGWTNALGVRLAVGRYARDVTTTGGLPRRESLLPLDVLAMWHLGSTKRSWGNLLFGFHAERDTALMSTWRSSPLYGLEGGYDLVRHLGIAFRWERSLGNELDYFALSMGLVYRH